MSGGELSKKQIRKGIVILASFVLLRATLTKVNLEPIPFLIIAFLVMSAGLVYLGFTRWIGVDLRKWWRYDRKRILRDIGWGLMGFIIVFIVTVLIMAPITIAASQGLRFGPGFVPADVRGQTSQSSPLDFLLMLFFGLAIAGFQEETIFRGFLQEVLTERFGRWRGNILQAATFSIAHVGYYSLDAWPLFLLAFVLGVVFGWLKMRRGTVIVPWIAHGLFG